jgi:hypothetical protein
VLTKGIVGADPTFLPYGTQIYVPGYGVGLVADTCPWRGFSLWVDLGYDDENWVSWSSWTDVYLLLPIPNNFPFVLPELIKPVRAFANRPTPDRAGQRW